MATPRAVPRAVWALIAFGLLSFGSSAILVRYAGAVPGLTIAAARTVLVALVVAPVAIARERRAFAALALRDRWAMVAAGVLLGLHFGAWIESVQRTTVATASVLVTTSPLFLVGFGALGWGDRPSRATLWAVAAGVAGAALIGVSERGAGSASAPVLGAALAVSAAALVAAYLLIGRAVRQHTSALAYFAALSAVGAATTVAVAAAAGAPLMPPRAAWGWIAAMALGPGLLGHGAMVVALRYLPATTVGLLSLAEPVLATVLAVVLLAESPSPLAVVGIGLVLGSIAAIVRRAA